MSRSQRGSGCAMPGGVSSNCDRVKRSRLQLHHVGCTVRGTNMAESFPVQPCTMRELLLYFLRLGTFGFGGPIALAGHMQHDLVETRRWISPQDYREGLALSQLSPGPLAAQLAMYLGWVRFGRIGSTLVAAAFILPSFVMVVILSALYLRYGGLPWMQAAFYGVGAAVIAVVARSAWKLAKTTVGRDPLLVSVVLTNAIVVAWTEREIVWVFALSGLVVPLLRRFRPPVASGTAASVFLP